MKSISLFILILSPQVFGVDHSFDVDEENAKGLAAWNSWKVLKAVPISNRKV
jgi:hypothetical protein